MPIYLSVRLSICLSVCLSRSLDFLPRSIKTESRSRRARSLGMNQRDSSR